MTYCPPNVSAQTLAPGVHEVYLMGMKPITDPGKLAKFQAQAVFIATYKSTDTAVEIDSVIKFNGSRADFYAGQTIDRLFLAAGLEVPATGEELDLTTLLTSIDGQAFSIEINEKGYVQSVILPGTEGEV